MKREIVSPRDFVDSSKYIGDFSYRLYDKLKDDFVEFCSMNYGMFGGAIGIGKTTFASLVIARSAYEILCEGNCNKIIVVWSDTDKLIDCDFEFVFSFLKELPIFEYVEKDDRCIEIGIDKCSVSIKFLSGDITNNKDVFDRVIILSPNGNVKGIDYYNIFYYLMNNNPYVFLIVYDARFISNVGKDIVSTINNENCFFKRYSTWGIKNVDIYNGDMIKVFFNFKTGEGVICEDDEIFNEIDEYDMIMIPIEFKEDFKTDIKTSLIDLAGIPIGVK